MNRHERRVAKAKARKVPLGHIINARIGRCLMAGEARLKYYACGKEAKEWPWHGSHALMGYGIAEIEESGQAVIRVPLCETCFNTEDIEQHLVRRVLQAPDMEFKDGGEASVEHILEISAALSEKEDATQH